MLTLVWLRYKLGKSGGPLGAINEPQRSPMHLSILKPKCYGGINNVGTL